MKKTVSQGLSVVAKGDEILVEKVAFPPCFCVLAASPDAFLFFPFLLSLHSSRHISCLRSHTNASYRAVVCISSDVLLLTVFLKVFLPSLAPSRAPKLIVQQAQDKRNGRLNCVFWGNCSHDSVYMNSHGTRFGSYLCYYSNLVCSCSLWVFDD